MADQAAAQAAQAKENTEKIQNAIRALEKPKPVPVIDFTLHVMDDGTTVNTQERVIKGTLSLHIP